MSSLSRTRTDKMMFYNQIADQFDQVVNMYDTNKRLDVVFNELMPYNLTNLKVLDAGCGTGWFSREAQARGAAVTALDVGEELLAQVAKKAKVKTKVGSVLKLPFKDGTFDIVMSNEVIEHVTDARKAIKEMSRVLKPGGLLVITTPNKAWHWSVSIANRLNLRPYQGLENWLDWKELEQLLAKNKLQVVRKRGIHAFPFQVKALHPILNFLDKAHLLLQPYMINIALVGQKK